MKLVLDTGPLLLLAAGRSMAGRHKRTMAFGEAGYVALAQFVAQFSGLIATPHVLTEAWNLSGNDDTRDPVSHAIKLTLRALTKKLIEAFEPSSLLASDEEFLVLGLSDTAQLYAAKSASCPLVTQDRKLWGMAHARGIPALHLDDLIGMSPAAVSASLNRRPT
jgi:predicted nucleic acid-binding protein